MLAKVPGTKMLILLFGWGLAGAGSSLLIGMDVNLIAEEIKKEVADRPKVTLKDIMGVMTGVTKKAFKGKNVMGAFGRWSTRHLPAVAARIRCRRSWRRFTRRFDW